MTTLRPQIDALLQGLDLDPAQRDLLATQILEVLTSAVNIPPEASIRVVFEAFDRWASEDRAQPNSDMSRATCIWNILSALRGPDHAFNGDLAALKYATTARLRNAVLPGLARRAGAIWSPQSVATVTDAEAERGGGHFARHIRWAIKAIQAAWPPSPLEQLETLINGNPTTEDLVAFVRVTNFGAQHAEARALVQTWAKRHVNTMFSAIIF